MNVSPLACEADIIALAGAPLDDINAVRNVVFVTRGGVVYKWPDAASQSSDWTR